VCGETSRRDATPETPAVIGGAMDSPEGLGAQEHAAWAAATELASPLQ